MKQLVLIFVCSLVWDLQFAHADEDHDEDERAAHYNPNWGRPMAPAVLPPINSPGLPPLESSTRCYVCSDCQEVLPTTMAVYSPPTFDPKKKNKCLVYTEKYRNAQKPVVVRGAAASVGTCDDLTRTYPSNGFVTLISCKECVGDLCNTSAAGRSILDTTVATVTILIAPLLAKRLLA